MQWSILAIIFVQDWLNSYTLSKIPGSQVYSFIRILVLNSRRTLSFNPFVHNAPFLYPMVFWCFQGVEKECIGNKWVNFSFYWLLLENFKLIMVWEKHQYKQTVPQQKHTIFLCRFVIGPCIFSGCLENIILALAWGATVLEETTLWHKEYHHVSDSKLSKNHLRVFFLNFQFSLMWADLNLTDKATKRGEFYV